MNKPKLTKANKTERKPGKRAEAVIVPEPLAGPGGELTPRQLKAIAALLEAPTIAAAAQAAGVARVTLYEWLKLGPFKEALEEARASIYRAGVDTLKGAAGAAAGRLIELLDSKNENTRRLSAHEILTLAIRIDEAQALEKRIAALEEALEAVRPGGPGLSMRELSASLGDYGKGGN